jgi:hypothetical protein
MIKKNNAIRDWRYNIDQSEADWKGYGLTQVSDFGRFNSKPYHKKGKHDDQEAVEGFNEFFTLGWKTFNNTRDTNMAFISGCQGPAEVTNPHIHKPNQFFGPDKWVIEDPSHNDLPKTG